MTSAGPVDEDAAKASEAEAVKQNLPRTYGGGKVVMEWARAARARGPRSLRRASQGRVGSFLVGCGGEASQRCRPASLIDGVKGSAESMG